MNPSSDSPKVGRPAKWANAAERQRAYRQRRARELADPLALRAELRKLRHDLNATQESLCLAERDAVALRRANAALDERNAMLAAQLEDTRAALERGLRNSAEPTAQAGSSRTTPEPSPGLNRQQRRAEERRRGKQR